MAEDRTCKLCGHDPDAYKKSVLRELREKYAKTGGDLGKIYGIPITLDFSKEELLGCLIVHMETLHWP